jgi:rhamnosyl/mannosyltransferase
MVNSVLPAEAVGDRPLRILILTSEAPPVVSGVSMTVSMLQRSLAARGHVVDVVSRADFPRIIRNEIRVSAFGVFWPSFYKRLCDYDVVNVHGPVPSISEMFLALSRTVPNAARPSIVYTHHSDLAIPHLERWCSVYNRLSNGLAHLADRIVVSSDDYQQRLQRSSGTPVDVVPWAVDVRGRVAGRTDRSDGPLRVLFVGQLRSYKGLGVLLDAVANMTGVEVTIVGDGPLREEIEARARGDDLRHVRLRGRISDDELWKVYSDHDVIVLPSTTTAEAYGLVLVEGMSAGCVPVASDLPGVRGVAAPTGLVVARGRPDDLREALIRLRDNPAWQRSLSRASAARAAGMTVESMGERYEQIMRAAVTATSGRQAPLAVPAAWPDPERFLDELASTVGVKCASLSLLQRRPADPRAKVWRRGFSPMRVSAPVARYVADINEPVLINADEEIDPGLKTLLHRPEVTSAILVPIRHTRRTMSVVGLSTSDSQGPRLDYDHLHRALVALTPLDATGE